MIDCVAFHDKQHSLIMYTILLHSFLNTPDYLNQVIYDSMSCTATGCK